MKHCSCIVMFAFTMTIHPATSHALHFRLPYRVTGPQDFIETVAASLIVCFIYFILMLIIKKLTSSCIIARNTNRKIQDNNDRINFKNQHLVFLKKLSETLVAHCKTHGHDPLHMLATADAFEGTVFRSASFKYLDSNVERAEVKLEYFLPLIESAHEAGKEEQLLPCACSC